MPEFDGEEIHQSNLYHAQLIWYTDSDSASENEYPWFDFERHEEHLDFLVDNLDGSKLSKFDSDFERFLLLDRDSQSCVGETEFEEDHNETKGYFVTG